MSQPCFVYLMTSDAPIWPPRDGPSDGFSIFKVGMSDSPIGRLRSLRTSSPYKIELRSTWRLPSRAEASWVEARFHRNMEHSRLSGEWFCDSVTGALCTIDETICVHAIEDLNFSPDRAIEYLCDTGCSPLQARTMLQACYGMGDPE